MHRVRDQAQSAALGLGEDALLVQGEQGTAAHQPSASHHHIADIARLGCVEDGSDQVMAGSQPRRGAIEHDQIGSMAGRESRR